MNFSDRALSLGIMALFAARLPMGATVGFLNGPTGDSRGMELSGRVQAFPWWTARAGCTYLEKDIRTKEGHLDPTSPRGGWIDAGLARTTFRPEEPCL